MATLKFLGALWTREQDDLLRKLYSSAPRKELLTAIPNRSWIAIKNRALRIGLMRNFIARYAGRTDGQLSSSEKIRWLRNLRQRLGLAQREVADIAGYDLSSIQAWENGRAEPSAFALRAWSDALSLIQGRKNQKNRFCYSPTRDTQ